MKTLQTLPRQAVWTSIESRCRSAYLGDNLPSFTPLERFPQSQRHELPYLVESDITVHPVVESLPRG